MLSPRFPPSRGQTVIARDGRLPERLAGCRSASPLQFISSPSETHPASAFSTPAHVALQRSQPARQAIGSPSKKKKETSRRGRGLLTSLNCVQREEKRNKPQGLLSWWDKASGEGGETGTPSREFWLRAPTKRRVKERGGGHTKDNQVTGRKKKAVKQRVAKLSVLKYLFVMNSYDGTLPKYLFNMKRTREGRRCASVFTGPACSEEGGQTQASTSHLHWKTLAVPLHCLCSE